MYKKIHEKAVNKRMEGNASGEANIPYVRRKK